MSISASSSIPVIAQALIGVFSVLALAIAPPVEGKMLIISLSGEDAAAITAWASQSGARILDRGPFAGSIVVAGRSRDLAGATLRHGSIIIAAPAAACGSGKGKA